MSKRDLDLLLNDILECAKKIKEYTWEIVTDYVEELEWQIQQLLN